MRTKSERILLALSLPCLAATALVATPTPASPQQAPDPAAYTALQWRHIGPEGNRFSAAAGIVGDPHTYYVGAASGGIYKTTDGGVHWDAIFDDQPVQSIGSLGVAEADPNVVWPGRAKARSAVTFRSGRASTNRPTPGPHGR